MDGSHSRSVTKILTAYWSKKTYFWPGARKTEMHSFPTMYIMGGVRLVEMGQNSDCLKKSDLKNSDFEGHNSGSPDFGEG